VSKTIYCETYKNLCRLLTKAREDAGLTQNELAEILDKPQSYISKYERGDRRLDVLEFLEVASALKVNASFLLDELQMTKSE